MKEKKHNLIYQITNLVNGKIYIGRHSTNNINDNYFGSGKEITKEVKLLGKESFKKEILFDFQTGQEMINKEIELLTKEFINSDSNYNLGSGQGGAFTHDEEARQKLREANTGFLTAKDKDGNTFRISKDDPRYLSGELKHNLHGLVRVRDSGGNIFCVPLNDPRRLTGELISAVTGTIRPKETTEKHTEFMKEYWSENKHSEEAIEKMRDANIGRVNVKDKNGKTFRVAVDDLRIESGELVNSYKGNVWVNNKELQKSRCVKPEKAQEFLNNGWELGLVYFNKKKRVWVSNPESQVSKQITEDKLYEFISNGWEVGRIQPENIGEKIRAGRKPGSWMINLETNETRIILKTEVDEYISNGWILGRILK